MIVHETPVADSQDLVLSVDLTDYSDLSQSYDKVERSKILTFCCCTVGQKNLMLLQGLKFGEKLCRLCTRKYSTKLHSTIKRLSQVKALDSM